MNSLKNRNISRIGVAVSFALAVLFSLLVFSSFTVKASAEEVTGETRMEIFAANLSFDTNLKVVYAVEATFGAGLDGSDMKMLFFNSGELDFTVENADCVKEATSKFGSCIELNGVTYTDVFIFESEEIAPEKLGDTLYARTVITDGEGVSHYSEAVKVGVLDYVYLRYRDAAGGGNVTEKQLENYQAILDYGAAAQIEKNYRADRLITSHGVRIETEGAGLADGFGYGTYLLGDLVTLTPDLAEYAAHFSAWENSEGEKVSSDRIYCFTVDTDSKSDIYKASYSKAGFDGLAEGALLAGADNAITSDGFSVYLEGGSDNFGAEISLDNGNGYLKLSDLDEEYGNGLNVASLGEGKFLILGLDFMVESFGEDSTPLQLQLGGYTIQFSALEDAALRIYDVGAGTGYLDRYVRAGEWHNVRLIVTNGDSPRSYLFIDGECVVKSLNVPSSATLDKLLIYGSRASTVSACFDNIELYRANISESEEESFAPARVIEKATSASNDRFQNAEILLDRDALLALKAMDAQLFSENIYLWIANLYDPETSALYFSISGRDSYGYLPDIETVSQGYGILSTLGLGGNTSVLNDEQKANLTAWIQTLQSNRDGYYYHPHWGVAIGNSRLSRDLGNSSSSYSASGSLAYRLFDDANYRLSGGKYGYKGTTVPSTYDNSLTGQLRKSVVSAVSKVIFASESSTSSMPAHLHSEENLVRYVNDQWNSTCKVAGTHERHFCTESCIIVSDPSDSYMKIEDGELIITRGYRCTSGHECAHSLGHSYSFGHHFTSMGSQVRSAGLGTPLVMYFRDIQENVQSSLRDKAEAAFIEENGQSAWDALSEEEQTEIRKAAENGIWEEQVTYGTISGLLKISGIPSTHGYEFLYAEAAIGSALKCALFSVEDFITTGQAIVSIYNPFNAINGIMNNINNYGTDKEVRIRARALIREHAEELIVNTAGKLRGYLMPDGGYSYNYSGNCTHSQGQPVAIAGSREGDVNGTALALGTRSALLSCLGISVSAPFGGVDAVIDGGFDLNGDGDVSDEFDLTGDGIADAFEAECTHNMRFRYIITTKGEIEKVDYTADRFYYTFDEGTLLPSGGEVTKDGDNNVLMVVDNDTGTGKSVTFSSSLVIDEEICTGMSFDMRIVECNNTTSHQLFLDSGVLRIDFSYSNGNLFFFNIAKTSTKLTSNMNVPLSVNANRWFTIDLVLYPNGKVVEGETVYGYFTVIQDGITQTASLSELASYGNTASKFRMYSLFGSKNVTYYDNVTAYNGIKAGVHDGEYHFDTVDQKIADDSILVKSPTFAKDTVYLLDSGTVDFNAYRYDDAAVIYNFNSVQANLLLSEAKAGERVDLILLDGEGRAITGIYLIVGENGELSIFAPNGQILTERIPRVETYSDGSSARVTKERDMILSADLSDWVLVKLEYHHDMEVPRLDIVVKYRDNLKSGYKTTTAAILEGADISESGADPFKFSTLRIDSLAKIYLDDLYIRNVIDGCSGEHEYIQKQTASTLKGEDDFGHKEYYLSCRNCGEKSEESFLIHVYERIIDDKFKISDATVNSAAVYAESCVKCGELSGDTFLHGLPLEDPTKYNFSASDGAESAIPPYLSIVTGKGKTATVMSEAVGNAVNYFLRIAKKNGQASHSITFRYQLGSGETVADKYIYEFDFRWIGASDMMNNRNVILVKMGAGGSAVCPGAYVASSDGSVVTYSGVNMHSGEWHAMKYLFARNETNDGWDVTAFIDGNKVYTYAVLGNAVPYLNYETRWNLTEGGVVKYTDLELDLDRLKISAVTEKGHYYEEIPEERYLISEANCLSPAIYAKVCKYCMTVSEDDTFTYGEISGHDLGNLITDHNKVCDADCERAATYKKMCKVCSQTVDETFTVGEPLGHDDVKTVISEATKTEAEISYFSCLRCKRVTDPEPFGLPLAYPFTSDKTKPDTMTVDGFVSEPLTTGVWACVLSEEVNGAVNYYLNVQKYEDTGTHNLTFKSTEDGKNKYIYEFDFRWHYSDRMRGNVPILLKIYQGSTQAKAFSLTAKSDGTVLYHNGVTFKSGEWHNVRYEFEKTSDGTGWNYKIIIDEKTVVDSSFTGTATPKVIYETRFGQTEDVDTDGDGVADSKVIKNCTDISFDIDNLYVKAE